jgi:cytochrome b561
MIKHNNNMVEGYTSVQKALHWLIAIMILSSLAVGFSFDFLSNSDLKNTLRNLHKLSGVIILFLVGVRIFFRVYTPAPKLPLSKWHVLIAKCSHMVLYVLMAAIPMSGWIMSSAVKKMPYHLPYLPLVPFNQSLAKQMYSYHGFFAYAIAILITVHISATFIHIYRGEPIFERMRPW